MLMNVCKHPPKSNKPTNIIFNSETLKALLKS